MANLTVTNYGGYNALLLGSYIYQGKQVNFRSPDILLFQSYSVEIPTGSTNLSLVSFFYNTFAGYQLISRNNIPTVTENLCFDFYGTIFNASFHQVQCDGVGGGNPDLPNCNPCCCCCCNCCCKCNPSYMY